MKRWLLSGALVFIAASASGEAPPVQPFRSFDWSPTMSKEPTKGITLGQLRVQFERTTLSDVQLAVGTGQIAQNSPYNVGEHVLWLCYTLPQPRATDRIWIISHGEMGGERHLVTAVTVTRVAEAGAPSDCPSLPTTMQPVSFDFPLWLGSPAAAFTAALGSPSHRHAAWIVFDFRTTTTGDGKCEGGYDFGNWLIGKSVGGRIVSLFAGQVTSC